MLVAIRSVMNPAKGQEQDADGASRHSVAMRCHQTLQQSPSHAHALDCFTCSMRGKGATRCTESPNLRAPPRRAPAGEAA